MNVAKRLSDLSAIKRVALRFDGRMTTIAAALGVTQGTVSGWDERGIPFPVAVRLVDLAAAHGATLTIEELAGWMADDIRRRAAAQKRAA